MTSQLSSLVKNRPPEQNYSRGGMTGDQMDELRVFDRLRPIKESESEHRLQASSKTEAEIDNMVRSEADLAPSQPVDEDGFLMDSDDDRDKESNSTSDQIKVRMDDTSITMGLLVMSFCLIDIGNIGVISHTFVLKGWCQPFKVQDDE